MKTIERILRNRGTTVSWLQPLKKTSGISTILLYLFIFIVGVIVYTLINQNTIHVNNVNIVTISHKTVLQTNETKNIAEAVKISEPIKSSELVEFPLSCAPKNVTQMCPSNYPRAFRTEDGDDNSRTTLTCPDYFRWIHEDLKPFKATGITRKMVEQAKKTAHFRLVILQGKVYIEKFRQSIQVAK